MKNKKNITSRGYPPKGTFKVVDGKTVWMKNNRPKPHKKVARIQKWIDKAILKMNIKPNQCKMGELGNYWFGQWKSGKEYFTSVGMEHVSYDWNGRDGALQVDLGSSQSTTLDTHDIVTNFGTSEHVSGQYWCFRNVHEMCKVGGVMIHAVPFKNCWPDHCDFRYSPSFFKKLSDACGYEIILNIVDGSIGGPSKRIACALLYKKDDSPFIPLHHKETFEAEFDIQVTQGSKNTASGKRNWTGIRQA